jgi:protein-tyrosine phosphatase
MLKMAAESGTTAIVGTPHADLEYKFQPDLISQRAAEIQSAVGPVPRIYTGCDFHLTFDNIQDALSNPSKYTINHKNYLLVEFSDMLIFQNTGEIFAKMRQVGIVPIITHPERNQLLQQRLPMIQDWVANGALAQVTGQSLLGHFGQKAKQFSLDLLKAQLVHFIASDAHDTKHRPPLLREAYEWMQKNWGDTVAEALFVDNPRAVVEGTPVVPFDSSPPPQSKKWFEFWR